MAGGDCQSYSGTLAGGVWLFSCHRGGWKQKEEKQVCFSENKEKRGWILQTSSPQPPSVHRVWHSPSFRPTASSGTGASRASSVLDPKGDRPIIRPQPSPCPAVQALLDPACGQTRHRTLRISPTPARKGPTRLSRVAVTLASACCLSSQHRSVSRLDAVQRVSSCSGLTSRLVRDFRLY